MKTYKIFALRAARAVGGTNIIKLTNVILRKIGNYWNSSARYFLRSRFIGSAKPMGGSASSKNKMAFLKWVGESVLSLRPSNENLQNICTKSSESGGGHEHHQAD